MTSISDVLPSLCILNILEMCPPKPFIHFISCCKTIYGTGHPMIERKKTESLQKKTGLGFPLFIQMNPIESTWYVLPNKKKHGVEVFYSDKTRQYRGITHWKDGIRHGVHKIYQKIEKKGKFFGKEYLSEWSFYINGKKAGISYKASENMISSTENNPVFNKKLYNHNRKMEEEVLVNYIHSPGRKEVTSIEYKKPGMLCNNIEVVRMSYRDACIRGKCECHPDDQGQLKTDILIKRFQNKFMTLLIHTEISHPSHQLSSLEHKVSRFHHNYHSLRKKTCMGKAQHVHVSAHTNFLKEKEFVVTFLDGPKVVTTKITV